MANLKGKFVIIDSGDSYQTGEIKEEINEYFVLVRTDFMNEGGGPAYAMVVVAIEEMAYAVVGKHEFPKWQLFNSPQERREYLEFFEQSPEEGKVVKLVDRGLR